MKSTPKISVILPNFNCERFIEKSIESILNQSFQDLELIIIDDASTDNSIARINKYLQDDRVKLIKLPENAGNYKARNIGIDQSKGKYIAVMDADDIADKDRLLIQYDFIKKSEFACVGSQGYWIDEEDKVIGNLDKPTDPDVLKIALLKNNFTLHPSLLFDKSLLQKHDLGKYDEHYSIASDYDFAARCATQLSVINLPERLVYYRISPTQISATQLDEQVKTARLVRIALLRRLGLKPTKKEIYTFHHLMEDSAICQHELEKSLFFLNKIISRNHASKVYSETILYEFFQSVLNQAQTKTQKTNWNLDQHVFKFIKSKFKRGSHILELGSGCGTNELLQNYKVTSIEHDFRFLLKRNNKHKIYLATILNEWYDTTVVKKIINKNAFDLIVIDGPPRELRAGILKYTDLFLTISCPLLFDDMQRSSDFETMHSLCKELHYEYKIINGTNKSFAYCEKKYLNTK